VTSACKRASQSGPPSDHRDDPFASCRRSLRRGRASVPHLLCRTYDVLARELGTATTGKARNARSCPALVWRT